MFSICGENLLIDGQKVFPQLSGSLFEEELAGTYLSDFDLYCENVRAGKLTTRSVLLDLLVGGGVEASTFYLVLCGSKFLRILVHRLLVNNAR